MAVFMLNPIGHFSDIRGISWLMLGLLTAPACKKGPEIFDATQSSEVRIEVRDQGFVPQQIAATAGQEITLVFVRTTTSPCAEEVVVPSIGFHQVLPMNEPVKVVLEPKVAGPIRFACGMNMMKGALLVREPK